MKNGKNLVKTQLLPEKLTVFFPYSHWKQTSQLKKNNNTSSCIILKMHDTSINFKGLYFNIHSQRQKLELLSLREERNWEGDGP